MVSAKTIALGIAAVAIAITGQVHGAWLSDTQSIMGTEVTVTAWHKKEAVLAQALSDVMDEMRRIDSSLSPYKPESELSLANRNAVVAPFAVSDELAFLIDKSLYFGRLSHGAFDITFASVGRYYDYRNKQVPEDTKRQALLSAIDYQHVKLNKQKQTLFFTNPHVYIDLGGMAKGYAVDRAAEVLKAAGVVNATVSAGGDSRVIGDKMGRPWIIGIKNPRQKAGESETVIRMPLENVAVSTSGDYERFFIEAASGERIHHILNPRTGSSAKGVVSVTILGDLGVDTDPLSTTVFVLGVEKGLALVNSLKGFDCVIIDSFGNTHYSDGLSTPNVN
ncbi:MAG: FAD:protein FMN transferase [Agarilytica sp.]